MTWTDESLKSFGWNIQRLIQKQDLSREESYAMFRQILLNQQPELQQGAFLAALVSKGETAREIAGAWQAIIELDTNCTADVFDGSLVENSGTGMDQIKTFNVSSAAAVVAAAGGVRLARHGARALTSTCGTVDLLEAVGIDVDCEVEIVVNSIKQTGIGIFNGMSSKVHPQSLARILSRIRFGSTLNIAASLANPCRPTHALRGVYSRDLIPKVAEVMKEIGYERAMVVHGLDAENKRGMDELSNLGESVVHEFYPNGVEKNYSFVPEDIGIKRCEYAAIAALGDIRKEAVRFMQVIDGTNWPECIDLTCLNSAALLYIDGKVNDLKTGVEASRDLIHSGRAIAKLSEWVAVQADPKKQGKRRYFELAVSSGINLSSIDPMVSPKKSR